ncbi:MAG: hypothetical protein J6Q78_07045 [Clostridia bacterium]|nr:hypothetical protein [Clostridia bacterium]
MDLTKREKHTRQLAVCAMLSALGVVLLYMGALIEVIDISMAVIASLLCVFAVIEYGGSAPWLVFAVTGVLSLLLSPRTPSMMYVVFFGYYPILKEKLEAKGKKISWIFKEVIFNVALVIMLVLLKTLFMTTADIPIELVVIAVVLAELVFVLYDFALTRLISLYIFKIRSRLKIKK